MKFLLLLAILLLASYSFLRCEEDYVALSNKNQAKTAREIQSRFGVHACGSGGGAINAIRLETLDFQTIAPLRFTIDQARTLIVALTEIYKENINNNRELRPYLIEYPFPAKRVEVAIFVYDSPFLQPTKDITTISLHNGIIYYKSHSGERAVPNTILKTEPYQTAYELVKDKIAKQDIPLLYKKPLPIPKEHWWQQLFGGVGNAVGALTESKYTGTKEERKVSWVLDAYGNQVAKRYGMKFHREGNFLDFDDPNENDVEYGLTFFSPHKLTLQEGRVFAAGLVADFFKKVNTDPGIRKYWLEYKREYNKKHSWKKYTAAEPVIQQLALKVGFWDANVERPQHPYLADIRFHNATFFYYEADPKTQALKLVYQEPYADALRFREEKAVKKEGKTL